MAESPEGTGTPVGESTGVAGDIGARDAVPREELPRDEPTRTALKRIYGTGLLWLMAVQLLVVNGVFLAYAWAGYDFRPPEQTVQVWLVATFVQIVSVVVIIARSLFPPERDQGTGPARRMAPARLETESGARSPRGPSSAARARSSATWRQNPVRPQAGAPAPRGAEPVDIQRAVNARRAPRCAARRAGPHAATP